MLTSESQRHSGGPRSATARCQVSHAIGGYLGVVYKDMYRYRAGKRRIKWKTGQWQLGLMGAYR